MLRRAQYTISAEIYVTLELYDFSRGMFECQIYIILFRTLS